MRILGIDPGVDAYSALLTVCVRCNTLDLAGDVYARALAEHSIDASVVHAMVAINSQIGAWDRFVALIDDAQSQVCCFVSWHRFCTTLCRAFWLERGKSALNLSAATK
jgi:hypothetical protein